MAKYAISPQGVQAFQSLAESLSSIMENIKTANKSLQTNIESVMDSTGIYGLEIWNVTLKTGDILSDGEESVNTLIAAINKQAGEIEQLFSLGGADSKQGLGSSSAGNVGSNGNSGGGLSHTNQTYNSVFIGGRTVSMFDHPRDAAAKGILNQGHNDLGMGGTCGLCSSGTVMNMGGNRFNETDVARYAKDRGLCNDSGGTSPQSRSAIISGMSDIPVDTVQVSSINDLVGYIENGQGVIIGVEASLYKPEWYGDYDSNDPKGHAMVLSSIVRDPNTNEILKYVVIDSNGTNAQEACQLVDPATLQRAFSMRGAVANVTRNILF